MPILNSIASWLMRKRMHQIELFMKYPHDVQNEWLQKLVVSAKNTEWGKMHDFKNIQTIEQFKRNIPLQDYDSLKPLIEKNRKGEQNILWHSEIKWFAKSSGTTNDKSKFIPVSQESLENCHYNGGRDMIAIHCNLHPETKLFTGKNLALAGSIDTDYFNGRKIQNGDLSAIVINNLPMWAEFFRAPNLSIALLENWDEKLTQLAKTTMNENIVSLAGVPSWMLLVLKKVLELSGKKNILDVWPNLEVYFHGGVNFNPYKDQFKTLFNDERISFLELYNATEGFFGIQDKKNSDELLLMLDYGIYYEFIPLNDNEKTITLDEVKTNINYALVITTSAGLWRYQLGDTIKFTCTNPYRFKITGRTKHFINAFGEELIVDNADKAIDIACKKTNSQIKEYTAAPIFMDIKNKCGGHEWLIEFEIPPNNLSYFTEVLDNALKSINSDYEAKRFNNLALKEPIIKSVPSGTFYKWLSQKNKLGGQYKIPRLSNHREYIEEMNALI